MKNSTILFGLVILTTLLALMSKVTIKKSENKIQFEKQFNSVNSSIQSGDQLPIIIVKRD